MITFIPASNRDIKQFSRCCCARMLSKLILLHVDDLQVTAV